MGGVPLDVCINSGEGPAAAAWVLRQQLDFPALRPLCLAVKALLAERRLGDASIGGLRCVRVWGGEGIECLQRWRGGFG